MFHFIELRRRILLVLGFFFIMFLMLFFYASTLFHHLMHPLLDILPVGSKLIATQLTTSFMTPLQLAADAAILCSAPYALYHIWSFITPGLYPNERQVLHWIMSGSLSLFFVGIMFGFYLILPIMMKFFVDAMPKDVQFMPDMAGAVDFITRMLLVFGLGFQVPLVCLILVRVRILSYVTLQQLRPYIIVAAFTLGMLLTPPDVFSQLMLAIPLCLLYEVGILLARFLTKEARVS